MQLALLRQRRHGGTADWTAWSQALAGLWLVSVPEVIEAAAKIDRTFWISGTRIKTGQVGDEARGRWARGQMEAARLEFINVDGRHFGVVLEPFQHAGSPVSCPTVAPAWSSAVASPESSPYVTQNSGKVPLSQLRTVRELTVTIRARRRRVRPAERRAVSAAGRPTTSMC